MRRFADDPPVEAVVGEALRRTGANVAVAETVTGGAVCALLCGVAGASDYVDRGSVVYGYDAHRRALGVTREGLDDHGAVSDPVARELAQRARDLADTTWGVSTTGIAGPSGGTADKPVGTAFVGVAHAGAWGSGASYAAAERFEFEGDRLEVIERTARAALSVLLDHVERAEA